MVGIVSELLRSTLFDVRKLRRLFQSAFEVSRWLANWRRRVLKVDSLDDVTRANKRCILSLYSLMQLLTILHSFLKGGHES